MKKKLLTLFLAVTVICMFSFGNIATAFADGADTASSSSEAAALTAGSGTGTGTTPSTPTITLDKTSVTIEVGKTAVMTATAAEGTTVTWTTSDANIATVSATGTITGVKAGTANVTATAGDQSAICSVTVTEAAKGDATSDSADVSTLEELKTALANTAVKSINIKADITVDSQLTLNHDVSISSDSGKMLQRKSGYSGYMISVPASNKLSLTNITFDGNKTETRYSMILDEGTLTIGNGTVLENNTMPASTDNITASNYGSNCGGAVLASGSASILMEGNAIIKNNSAPCGSGIALTDSATMIMNGGTITANSFTSGNSDGGGIAVGKNHLSNDTCTLTINSGSIDGNVAVDGSGICVGLKSSVIMNGGSISNNGSTKSGNYYIGGGAYICGNFKMTGGAIDSNSAICGGGMSLNGTAEITGGELNGNKAIDQGGGIFIQSFYDPQTVLNISNASISGNSAAYGGGIMNNGFNTSAPAAMESATDAHSAVIIGKGAKINENHAQVAGGILNSAGNLTINDGEICNNTADNYAGGIYNYSTTYTSGKTFGYLLMNGGTISGNKTPIAGGIYNYGKCTINNGTITSNEPTSDKCKGSAIYVVRDVELSPKAAIKGDCFIYFDTYSNLLLTGSFLGHDTIEISVPDQNAKYPSAKGFQVIKPGTGYTALTKADKAAFKCIGNGTWQLHIVDPEKDKDYAAKNGTIVLWDSADPADPIIIPDPVTPVNPNPPVVDPGDNNNTDNPTDPTKPTKPTKPTTPVVDPGDNNNTGEPTTHVNTKKDTPVNNNAEQPKTDDENNVMPWAVMGITSALAAGAVIILRKKEENN